MVAMTHNVITHAIDSFHNKAVQLVQLRQASLAGRGRADEDSRPRSSYLVDVSLISFGNSATKAAVMVTLGGKTALITGNFSLRRTVRASTDDCPTEPFQANTGVRFVPPHPSPRATCASGMYVRSTVSCQTSLRRPSVLPSWSPTPNGTVAQWLSHVRILDPI